MTAIILTLTVLLLLFYLSYRIIVFIAKRLVQSEIRKEVIDAEVTGKGSRLSLKLKEWFNWNVQVNYEKGTAGGNMKLNFPVKSAIALAFICLAISLACAALPIVSWLVPVIFGSFAAYHFLNWYRSLKIARDVAEWNENLRTEGTIPARVLTNRILGGVCMGLSAYWKKPVLAIRLLFVVLFFFWGIGLFLYLVLWIFLPVKTA